MELFGGKGNDRLTGSRYDDILAGGDGNDTLSSCLGKDIYIGGLGRDRYGFQGRDDIAESDEADNRSDGSSGFSFPLQTQIADPTKHQLPDELYGDWNGDGTIDRGYYIQSLGLFWLPNHVEQTDIFFGLPGDWAIVGNWQGKTSPFRNGPFPVGYDSPGIFRWASGTFHFDTDEPGYTGDTPEERGIAFGLFGDHPVVGDFYNEGIDRVGVFRAGVGRFFLEDGSPAGILFGLPGSNELPAIGDWNNDGFADVGVYRTGVTGLGIGLWLVDDSNRGHQPNGWINETVGIPFGLSLEKPVVWDFDKNGADDLATVSDEGRWRIWVPGSSGK